MGNTLLLTEEQRLLKKTIADFCEKKIKPNAQRLDSTEEFPTIPSRARKIAAR